MRRLSGLFVFATGAIAFALGGVVLWNDAAPHLSSDDNLERGVASLGRNLAVCSGAVAISMGVLFVWQLVVRTPSREPDRNFRIGATCWLLGLAPLLPASGVSHSDEVATQKLISIASGGWIYGGIWLVGASLHLVHRHIEEREAGTLGVSGRRSWFMWAPPAALFVVATALFSGAA